MVRANISEQEAITKWYQKREARQKRKTLQSVPPPHLRHVSLFSCSYGEFWGGRTHPVCLPRRGRRYPSAAHSQFPPAPSHLVQRSPQDSTKQPHVSTERTNNCFCPHVSVWFCEVSVCRRALKPFVIWKNRFLNHPCVFQRIRVSVSLSWAHKRRLCVSEVTYQCLPAAVLFVRRYQSPVGRAKRQSCWQPQMGLLLCPPALFI